MAPPANEAADDGRSASIRIGLLGPLEVQIGGRPVVVPGARLRSLLTRLAVESGRRVSAVELADAVWGLDPPTDLPNALQSLVSRLRRVLGVAKAVVQEATGYRLVEPVELDAAVFAQQLSAATSAHEAGDLDGADELLTGAIALWRGEPLSDAGEADYAESFRIRWYDLLRSARIEQVEIALTRGRAGLVVGELEELVERHPLDETLVALLMRALQSDGRGPEALVAYEQLRRTLLDDLGVDPGRQLQALHLELLRNPSGGATGGADPAGVADRTNLRAWLTSFVGREADLSRVLDSVRTHRLSTLLGPGGAGKTRLASEAAARWVSDDREQSAWLVELAPVTEAANIPSAILGALGLRDARVVDRAERAPADATDRLLDVLSTARCLVVIDNCEHLIEPVAQIVDLILTQAPGVRILTTSREPLALIGEAICPLSPLTLPPADASLEQARDYASVQLWLDRARIVRTDFVLDDQTLAPVVEIIRRLDGLPLAIELAAARLRVLPVTEIAVRLSDRFRLLTGGHRAGLPRHRTLRAVVEWSWELTSPAERLLAERLAVFPAGASSTTATAVCADPRLPPEEIDALLLALVDKSLLQSVSGPEHLGLRFRMLETIREYGTERLAERDELQAARLAHAHYFAARVVDLEPVLRGADQLEALHTLEVERENVLAALRFLGDSGRPREALRVTLALVWYWWLLGSSSEALTWLEFVISLNHSDPPVELVFARAALALTLSSVDFGSEGDSGSTGPAPPDWDQRQAEITEIAVELVDAPVAPFPGIEALRPMVAHFARRTDLAQLMAERGRASPDRWVRAALLATVAFSAENDSDMDTVRELVPAAYAEFTQLGDRWGLSSCLLVLARIATLDGRIDDATADYREAWRLLQQLGTSGDDESFIKIRIAELYARQGDWSRARDELESIVHNEGRPLSGYREMAAEITLATIEWLSGDTDSALRRARDLRRQVLERVNPHVPIEHLTAVVFATAGGFEAAVGELAQAEADLAQAYSAGVSTGDMPIVAAVGLNVVALALALDRVADGAAILGASAQIRGGDDPQDPMVRRLSDALRARGPDFEAAYDNGRSLPREEAIARLDPQLIRRDADSHAAPTARR